MKRADETLKTIVLSTSRKKRKGKLKKKIVLLAVAVAIIASIILPDWDGDGLKNSNYLWGNSILIRKMCTLIGAG